MNTKVFSLYRDREKNLAEMCNLLRQGDILAFPTETVYGLGADIFNAQACKKIFVAKNRPAESPLTAHISDLSQVEKLCDNIPKQFYSLAEKFLPGPLSIILFAKPEIPSVVTANSGTLGIRFPDEKNCEALISSYGTPLAATSANISGKPSPINASFVMEDLAGKIAGVLDGGECKYKYESTIVSLTGELPIILRSGAISKEQLEEVLKGEVLSQETLYKRKHYSPSKDVAIVTDLAELASLSAQKNKLFIISNVEIANSNCRSLSLDTFYENLRLGDSSDADMIVIYADEKSLAIPLLAERIEAAARK